MSHSKLSKNKLIVNMFIFTRAVLGDYFDSVFLPLIQRIRESFEIEMFQKYIKKGMVVLDIGANVGTYSIIAANKVGKNGKVFAFEPEEKNVRTMKSIVKRKLDERLRKVISIVPKAVTRRSGNVVLYVDKIHPATHSIVKGNAISLGKTENVKSVSIDSFLENKSIAVDVIKIDVDGADAFVVQGAIKTINKFKPVIFLEYWPEGLKRAGIDPSKFIKMIKKFNYKINNINSKERIVEKYSSSVLRNLELQGGYTNLLLIPK